MKNFKIGVFAIPGKRKWNVEAYSLWYNPEWTGFVGEMNIIAENGTKAKKKAISIWREKLKNIPFQDLSLNPEEKWGKIK